MRHREQSKVAVTHWDSAWASAPRMRLPSPLLVSTRNRMRLLRSCVKPGMRFLEIGCAPGKLLAYVAKVLGADVSGLDYSDRGVRWARELFGALQIKGDIRCEDVFATTFAPASFDVVHSAGLIEHFEDPREIVRIHMELLRPGGTALITIPNFSGWYRRLAQFCDPENLRIHNLDLMDCHSLERLVPDDLGSEILARPAGHVCLSAVNLHRRMPLPVARLVQQLGNAIGLVQPLEISWLCPQLVLKAVRK